MVYHEDVTEFKLQLHPGGPLSGQITKKLNPGGSVLNILRMYNPARLGIVILASQE